VVQVVELLPSKHKFLSSVPSSEKIKIFTRTRSLLIAMTDIEMSHKSPQICTNIMGYFKNVFKDKVKIRKLSATHFWR
jgi:hypothetical protein